MKNKSTGEQQVKLTPPALPGTVVPHADSKQTLIAIAPQGSASALMHWIGNASVWNERLKDAVGVHLFVGSFDKEVSCPDSGGNAARSYCEFVNLRNTTWTTGRNKQAHAILRHERKMRRQYKYWVFVDEDTLTLECAPKFSNGMPRTPDDPCWVTLLDMWARADYPIATTTMNANNLLSVDEVVVTKTYDAMINAFHRRAVPVFLPYISKMDNRSWWASQAILFHLTSGCLTGSGFVRFMGFTTSSVYQKHTAYPNGRDYTREESLAVELRTKYGVPNWAVPDVGSKRTQATEQGYLMTTPHLLSELSADVWNADMWTRTASWRGCRALEKRFIEFAGDPSEWI
jgi:hypothetical protein